MLWMQFFLFVCFCFSLNVCRWDSILYILHTFIAFQIAFESIILVSRSVCYLFFSYVFLVHLTKWNSSHTCWNIWKIHIALDGIYQFGKSEQKKNKNVYRLMRDFFLWTNKKRNILFIVDRSVVNKVKSMWIAELIKMWNDAHNW